MGCCCSKKSSTKTLFYDVTADSIFERDIELALEQVVEAPLATPDVVVDDDDDDYEDIKRDMEREFFPSLSTPDDDIIVVYTCRRYIHLLNTNTQTDMVYDHLLDRCKITYRTQTYVDGGAREAPVGGAKPVLERRRSL